MTDKTESLLTMRDIAEYFGVSLRTVQTWVKAGGIPHLKAGGIYRFQLSEVVEWARARGCAPAPAKAAV